MQIIGIWIGIPAACMSGSFGLTVGLGKLALYFGWIAL